MNSAQKEYQKSQLAAAGLLPETTGGPPSKLKIIVFPPRVPITFRCGHQWFFDLPEVPLINKRRVCPDCKARPKGRIGKFKDYTKRYKVL